MKLIRHLVPSIAVLLLVGCHETTAPDPRTIPTALSAATVTSLTGTVGSPVLPAPSVRVVNSGGDPIPDIEVRFTIGTGSGSVQGATVRTDAQGVATVGSWTMGKTTGTNTLVASVTGIPSIEFSAIAAAGPPTTLALVSGEAQSDTTHATLSPIVFHVTDAFGNVVAGAAIDATIAADAGTMDVPPLTGADGQTQLRWTLGETAGVQTARAQLRGLSSTAIILHATTQWPQISARTFGIGYNHGCAVLANGRLFCWGDNSAGQIGDGSITDRPVAVAVADGMAVRQIVAGALHTCALTTAGETWCWGTNRWSQLGSGSPASRPTPAIVPGLPPFVDLVSGADHLCGRTAGGSVYCWGFMNNATVSTIPVQVSDSTHFQSIASGSYLTCGLDDAGTTQCFGRSTDGQWHPQPMVNGPRLVALAGGLNFMCGITAVGAAYCWGNNDYGQLGTGTPDSSTTPVAVAGGHAFRSIHSGYDFACGIALTGETYCWGHASWGTLGVESGPQINRTPVILPVPTGMAFASLAGGFYHMCGITTTSTVQCWGGGFDGQLGDGISATTDQFHHRATPAPALRH